jgi:hypothetical protein
MKLNDVRNRVAHGLWVPFSEGGTVYHASRNKLKPVTSINQTNELEKCADEANDLRAELEKLFFGGMTLRYRTLNSTLADNRYSENVYFTTRSGEPTAFV